MIRFSAGDVAVTVLDGGAVRLDGGAMFGVVPKPLWERHRAPDDRNRIRLGMNVLLVEDGRRRWLVDTGAGTKEDAKFRDIYGLEPKTAQELLAPAGLVPEDIDVVVNSHLHFDHAGGNTARDARGDVVSAFPNARFVVQRGELEFARWDNERIRASYLADNFDPIDRDGRFDLVEGDVALGPHLSVERAPGHVPNLHVVVVDGGARKVCFLADLVPTATHVPYPWIMGYDLEPLETLASKKRLLPRAVREGWILVFEHDADLPVGVLEEKGGRLSARPFEPEA
ncbi:MAG TPA: MBL fold metallo-hydrolase [Candidatus Polarisedimenticolaceae bacterium]